MALVRFLLLTGARFGEAARATWTQFDLEPGAWAEPAPHTEQKRTHTAPLSAPALALLARDCARSAGTCVFPGPFDRPITTIRRLSGYRSRWQAGIEGARLHDLRHSFASVLVSGGASLPLIGSLLGHTQPSTTPARYSHLHDDAQRAAVERVGEAMAPGAKGSADVVPLRSKMR